MKIVPYRKGNDLRPLSSMLSLFDDFFNRAFDEESTDENFRAMAMDIVEHDSEFEILANLPGFTKENIKISVHDNQLVIEATCADKKEEKKGTIYRCERYSGSFRRSLILPDNVDNTQIGAKMEHGVLKLTVPKKAPSPKKEIVIE